MGSACSSGGGNSAAAGGGTAPPSASPSTGVTPVGTSSKENNNHIEAKKWNQNGTSNGGGKPKSAANPPGERAFTARQVRVASASSSLSSCSVPGTVVVNSGGGDANDGDDELSRPPTPFSRPLTGRIAQRPRTTTIYEREHDAAKARATSGGSLSISDYQAESLQVPSAGAGSSAGSSDGGAPRPRSSGGLLGVEAALAAKSAAGPDEAFPALVGKRFPAATGADEQEIDKLKKFLQEKGL